MRNLKDFDTRAMKVDDIEAMLPTITIFEKMAFSGITKEQVREKLYHLRTVQVPNRSVYLDMDAEELVFAWFKNWLPPALKHWVSMSPRDKFRCSERVLKNDAKQDALHFYENGQHMFEYTLQDIDAWVNS